MPMRMAIGTSQTRWLMHGPGRFRRGCGGRRLGLRAQPERVGDDEDRGGGHGDGGDQWRDMAGQRQRQDGDFVGHRHRQILAHQHCRALGRRKRHGDGAQRPGEEDRVGGVAPHLRGAARSHGDMRGGKCRRIVQTVADHQQGAALPAQFFQPATLSAGSIAAR